MNKKLLVLVGELFIIAGGVLALWLFYQSNVTNTLAAVEAQTTEIAMNDAWKKGDPVVLEPGESFAKVYIPKLKSRVWGTPVKEGTSQKDLNGTLGHYSSSALPGEIGNFALAGHRVTHGEPFRDFPKLKTGDLVFVEMSDTWFTYRLDKTLFVEPSRFEVVTSMPMKGVNLIEKQESWITLTTCDPEWNSTRRWIWFGSLVEMSNARPSFLGTKNDH